MIARPGWGNDFRFKEWQPTEFIWNVGIVAFCDQGKKENPLDYFERENALDFNLLDYSNIQAGNLVCVKCRFVRDFYDYVLKETLPPFVLIVSDGDESFPSESRLNEFEIDHLLNHKSIICIYAQNCDYLGEHPKLKRIPIGIDFHTVSYKAKNGCWGEIGSPLEQERNLKNILATLSPTYLRKKQAFVDFQYSDSIRLGNLKRYLKVGETRDQIFWRFARTRLIDHDSLMNRLDLWKRKGQYAFSISPHGNGLDCHRTWEDLVLGCIVIVKTSPLDSLYEGLPVVIVQDWSEITQENLEKWLNLYGDAFTNPKYRERLTLAYWVNQIKRSNK